MYIEIDIYRSLYAYIYMNIRIYAVTHIYVHTFIYLSEIQVELGYLHFFLVSLEGRKANKEFDNEQVSYVDN